MSQQTSRGFADEMRVWLRSMVRRVWGRRGVRVCQRLQLAARAYLLKSQLRYVLWSMTGVATPITLTEEERSELLSWTRQETKDHRLDIELGPKRAKIAT